VHCPTDKKRRTNFQVRTPRAGSKGRLRNEKRGIPHRLRPAAHETKRKTGKLSGIFQKRQKNGLKGENGGIGWFGR